MFGEKLILKIPENLITLLSNVIRVLLDKSGNDQQEIEKYLKYVEKPEGKEQIDMFEAVIESIIEGRMEAKEEGREESRKEERVKLENNVRNALVEGFPLETIHKITGLDMETIKKLALELNKKATTE